MIMLSQAAAAPCIHCLDGMVRFEQDASFQQLDCVKLWTPLSLLRAAL